MTDLVLFFIASLMLNITPGSDMLYVITRSASGGFKGGLYSAIGIFIGCLVHITTAVLGISLLIAKSALLFSLVKLAGAGYLVYLGIKVLFGKSHPGGVNEKIIRSDVTFIKQGIITNVLNPKVAIFFLSFLPQFIDANSVNVQLQLLLLGLWFNIQGTLILIIIAFFIGKTRNFFKHYPRFWAFQGKLTGIILLGLGIKLATSANK